VVRDGSELISFSRCRCGFDRRFRGSNPVSAHRWPGTEDPNGATSAAPPTLSRADPRAAVFAENPPRTGKAGVQLSTSSSCSPVVQAHDLPSPESGMTCRRRLSVRRALSDQAAEASPPCPAVPPSETDPLTSCAQRHRSSRNLDECAHKSNREKFDPDIERLYILPRIDLNLIRAFVTIYETGQRQRRGRTAACQSVFYQRHVETPEGPALRNRCSSGRGMAGRPTRKFDPYLSSRRFRLRCATSATAGNRISLEGVPCHSSWMFAAVVVVVVVVALLPFNGSISPMDPTPNPAQYQVVPPSAALSEGSAERALARSD
jgi:hypothetical protein